MALHDREVQDIIGVEPCHKFTWCLDACIREKNIDIKPKSSVQGSYKDFLMQFDEAKSKYWAIFQ
jgi:hypothetical protein